MNETPAFPMAPAPFTGESREVDPGACFDWLRQGWAMFLVNPGVWIGSTVLMLIILMVISIVPILGQIAASLLVPLFGAGMFLIARRIRNDDEPTINDLFSGFHQSSGSLVMVGVYFAIGVFGLAFVGFLSVTSGVLSGVITGKIAGFGVSLSGLMLASLLVFVLSIPVIMATWFAPGLVFFHHMQPLAAMKVSFAAGANNLLPMMIFAVFLGLALFCAMLPAFLIVTVFFAVLPSFIGFAPFFAMLPAFLALALVTPVFSGAVYASYRDIFVGS